MTRIPWISLFILVCYLISQVGELLTIGFISSQLIPTFSLPNQLDTLFSEPWRLFSWPFIQSSPFHFSVNLIALFLLEQSLAKSKLTALTFLSGCLLGALFFYASNPTTPLIGASCGVLGMAGYGLFKGKTLSGFKGIDAFQLSVTISILAIFPIFSGTSVSLFVHIGGLLAGIGIATMPTSKNTNTENDQ